MKKNCNKDGFERSRLLIDDEKIFFCERNQKILFKERKKCIIYVCIFI